MFQEDVSVFVYYQQGQSTSSACLNIPVLSWIYSFELRVIWGLNPSIAQFMILEFDFRKYFMFIYLLFLEAYFTVRLAESTLSTFNKHHTLKTLNANGIGHLYISLYVYCRLFIISMLIVQFLEYLGSLPLLCLFIFSLCLSFDLLAPL